MARPAIELLVVGSVAFDTVTTPAGQVRDALGGSATYFAIAAAHFARVGVVAVVGEDFGGEQREQLITAGIDLQGLTQVPGSTFRWVGRYEAGALNQAITLATHLNVFQDFDPRLPASYRRAPLVFLGNIAPELQRRVLDQVEARALVGLDTMNYWIANARPALLEVLRRVHLLFVNEAEARLLSECWSLREAIAALLRMGPRALVVKCGEYGALCCCGSLLAYTPAFPAEQVKDPTGAGDSFAGGFMGRLARESGSRWTDTALRRALAIGTVLGSRAVEEFSIAGIASLDATELARRYRVLQQMARIPRYSAPRKKAGR